MLVLLSCKGGKKLKKIIGLLMVFMLVFSWSSTEATASTKKVGVLFSELNEEYAKTERPAGQQVINGQKKNIDRKDSYSSIWDKSLKVFHSLQDDGYNVTKINENNLNNQSTLQQFDTIVFPYSVLMTHKQRQVIKQYVRDGGGVVFIYAGARNQADTNLWKTSQYDLTPMIYKTESWIWQWDNLSEIFSSGFVSDNHVTNLKIGKGKSHVITQNAERELGRPLSFVNTRSNGEWLELSSPYSNYVVPLLQIEQATPQDGKGQYVQKGKPIALATEYGHGRVVTIGFKMYDFLDVKTPGVAWRDGAGGAAYSGTQGSEDARVFLNETVNWTAAPVAKPRVLTYDVKLSTTDLKAYASPRGDYVIYGTSHVQNSGDTPVRGTLLTEVYNPNGQVIAKYERYLPGRTPYNVQAGPQMAIENKHSEKFQFNIPLRSASGQYEVRTTFVEGHKSSPGYKIRAASTIMTKNGTAPAKFTTKPNFNDVRKTDDAYEPIRNLSNLGIIRGFKPTIFRPNQSVTRKQAAEMILKATNEPVRKGLSMSASDMSTKHPNYDLMATAVQLGILNVENGKVDPNRPITRAEMANALVKGFKFEAIPQTTFNDVPNNAKYSEEIHILSQLGVAKGYVSTNTFKPNDSVKRNHFASFVDRALRAVQK